MHESRGNPNAHSCSGAIGVFQLLASDAVLPLPSGCPESNRRTFAGNHPTSVLLQSSKNIWIGLDHLEDYTWQARVYVQDLKQTWEEAYRPEAIGVPEAVDLEWWYTEEGKVTLAMNQCGPTGYREGRCGRLGGDVYASDVLDCWVPWVQEVLESVCPEDDFVLKLRQQSDALPSYINLKRRK